jgi:hypothetical protein
MNDDKRTSMSMLKNVDYRRKVGTLALGLALAMAGVGVAQAQAAAEATDAAGATETTTEAPATPDAVPAADAQDAAQLPQDAGRRRQSVSPLERRVILLAKELGLDATQQAHVKKVLESQREQVARVWNDESIPPARRVSATQAIGDRTADDIRAVLNDEQRKKYIQPRRRDAPVGTAGGDAEAWMKSGKGK